MSRCVHCGESSGLLRREHAACRERHDTAVGQFPGFFVKYLASPMSPDKFRVLADDVAAGAYIRGEEFKTVCVSGIEAMVEAATTDGELAAACRGAARQGVAAGRAQGRQTAGRH